MGSILENYDVLSRVILQALVNSIWPGLMLMLLAWLTMRLNGRTSATTRHAIWVVCLFALAALPFLPLPKNTERGPSTPIAPPLERLATVLYSPAVRLTPVISRTSANLLDVERARSQSPSTGSRDIDSQRSDQFATAATSREGSHNLAPLSDQRPVPVEGVISRWIGSLLVGRVPATLVAIWLIISSFLAARIAWSYLFLFRIRRRLGLVPPAYREHARQLAEVVGVRRRVRVFTSTLVGAPMTIGWLRPLVILPPDLLRTLGEAELHSILAHEMAHIKRWDYLTNLLQRLAQAVFFFHPAVWVIGRQLSVERELACDDWAVKMTGEPRRYARCLTRLVETMSGARSFAAATGIIFGKHVISRRIEMILNRDRNATTSVSKAALYSAIGSAGLAVVLASLISPVIAIPLPTAALQSKAESPRAQVPRPAVAVVAPSEETTLVTPFAPIASTVGRAQIAPVAPDVDSAIALLPIAPIDEPVFELLETIPATPIAAPLISQPMPPLARLASYRDARQGMDLFAQTAAQAPQPAQPAQPRGRLATGIGFGDDRNATPAIPEAELLAVLTDVVKRDADPNVRAEALRGIYRFRNDAGVNALLQLYDSVPDPKTKGEIVSYLLRSEGDNARSIAKLLQIAKTEKDETLRSRALSQLAKVKGDEGAGHLIQIYDSLQDSKEKQTVIRYLGQNRSRKAADKLIQIAKNDTDPAVRQSAIRSLYAIDNRLYLDLREKGLTTPGKVSQLFDLHKMDFGTFHFDQDAMKLQMEEAKRAFEDVQLDFHFQNDFHFDWEPKRRPEVKVNPPAGRIK